MGGRRAHRKHDSFQLTPAALCPSQRGRPGRNAASNDQRASTLMSWFARVCLLCRRDLVVGALASRHTSSTSATSARHHRKCFKTLASLALRREKLEQKRPSGPRRRASGQLDGPGIQLRFSRAPVLPQRARSPPALPAQWPARPPVRLTSANQARRRLSSLPPRQTDAWSFLLFRKTCALLFSRPAPSHFEPFQLKVIFQAPWPRTNGTKLIMGERARATRAGIWTASSGPSFEFVRHHHHHEQDAERLANMAPARRFH